MINYRLWLAEEIGKDEELRKRLNWYFLVLEKKVPSKIHIASSIPIEENLSELSYEELWKLHDEKSREFKEKKDEILNGKIFNFDIHEKNYLDLKIEILKRMIKSCILCERKCGVNREEKVGVCLVDKTRVSEYFLHYGEELPLIPSGTIFFTGCNFKCVFCQNWSISQFPKNGYVVNYKELAEIQVKLYKNGAKNINWVGGEPTPNLLEIVRSMKEFAKRKIIIPQLWNSNMYLTIESMKILLDLIDIWLPDFKYGNNKCALRYSKVNNYFEVVSRNLLMLKDESVIIRHLVLPNHIECCSKPVLDWISKNIPDAVVNIMDQYHPDYLVLNTDDYKDINRKVSEKELLEVYKYAESLGLYWKQISLY